MSSIATSTDQLYSDTVLSQSQNVPYIYGKINFGMIPERFTTDPDTKTQLDDRFKSDRQRLLANDELVKMMRDYTMTGDDTADAYAGLIHKYGFAEILKMLGIAVRQGIDAVENPPQELRDFIKEMETSPDWVNMDLIEKGAKEDRLAFAFIAPYVIRGGLLATFLNKYTALPMAITGAFSSGTAAKRVKETASFFGATVMPKALERNGEGFLAAAQVRLMHSMVRFNIMRKGDWNSEEYGVPIPQSDQMPAGMLGIYLMALDVIKSGRTQFSEEERARAELYRYRCYLLGLPEDLLENDPQRIIDLWNTRRATLKYEFEDATCGKLFDATLRADLSAVTGSGLGKWMEQGFFKMYFVKKFMNGSQERAKKFGVNITPGNKIAALITAIWAFGNIKIYKILDKTPLSGWADRRVVKRMQRLLTSLGHAEYVTDARQYAH